MLRARTLSTPSRPVTVECTLKSSREELLLAYHDRNGQGREEEGKELIIMTMRRVDEPKVGERWSKLKECGVNAGTRDRYRESRYYTEFEGT